MDICVGIFGLLFIFYGIWMIYTKKGGFVLSNKIENLVGSKAVEQGVIAIIVGIAILFFAFLFARG